ncbi:MAG TPA: DUF1801 domain-containing protein [Anaerolineae bacterium]|nr:DUF1801 domain-containing protein [Anaerolineae bacterium]
MATSNAATVEEYLNELPAERRAVIEQVRQVILDNLPPGYQESMNWGMISYEVPLARYPKTYNKKPLGYLALAAQKNYYTLYLMAAYSGSMQEGWLQEQFDQAGKKLDMGKSCLHFRKLDDLPMNVIAQAIAMVGVDDFIAQYEKSRQR